jgi:DNA repair exonuclease SbcCD ATPase subunit
LRQKYAPKIEQLNERKRRAEQAVEREAEQAKGQKLQTAISFGATLLSSFMGRKTVSLTTLGRATTAVRGVGRSMKEAEDVGRAQENVATIDQKLAELDEEFKAETEKLERAFDPQTEELGKVSLKPTKANISVKFLSLAWAPYWHEGQVSKPAWE